jgi:hypothetical protein
MLMSMVTDRKSIVIHPSLATGRARSPRPWPRACLPELSLPVLAGKLILVHLTMGTYAGGQACATDNQYFPASFVQQNTYSLDAWLP